MAYFLNFLSSTSEVIDSVSKTFTTAARDIAQAAASKEKFWLINDFNKILTDHGVGERIADLLAFVAACGVLTVIVWFIDRILVKISLAKIKRWVSRTNSDIDDVFFEHKFFHRLLQLVPLVVLLYLANIIFAGFSAGMILLVNLLVKSIIIFGILLVVYSLLDVWNELHSRRPLSNQKYIKGYIQVAKIVFGFIAGILIISTLAQKELSTLLIGLGTAAALFSLVFKDTILGFVASIQLSAQDMVRIGDWISMPSKNADGTVIEINVNSVKVQNWDNTVTMIPIYSMVSESFTNWRAMEQSGGRRFTRNFHVNIESVKFADAKFLDRIREDVAVENHYQEMVELARQSSSGETMTNLALFRAHIELFVKTIPEINENLPLFVRYTPEITDKGIGIEIYAFSYKKTATELDPILRMIVEYVVASTRIFEIVLFQSPTGEDFRKVL